MHRSKLRNVRSKVGDGHDPAEVLLCSFAKVCPRTFKAKPPRREVTTEAATNARLKRTGFSPKGKESQQGNTSMEDTAPAGVDVADPGIPGRAFARDSLERCRTSKKLEQSAESYHCPAHRLNPMHYLLC